MMTNLPRQSILSRHRVTGLELVWWALAIAVFFLFPQHLALATSVMVMIILVLSFDLLLGFAGVLSFGHGLFFGFGAFTAGWLSLAGWTEPISCALAGAAASALLAAVVGPFVLRLTGLPLLMVTLALGVLAFELAHKATDITGGDDGLSGIVFSPVLGRFRWGLGGETRYVYVLCWLFAVFVLLRVITSSPFGVTLQGIRENSARMRLLGNPVLPHLTVALVISAAIAGLAGALMTQTNAFVGLGVLALDTSVDVLVMLVLGGIGSLYGALVGVPFYMVLKHFSAQWNPFYWMFAIGALLIVVVLFARGGLVSWLSLDRLKRRRLQQ
jgi:branched-chain amino acid transport system permease protein